MLTFYKNDFSLLQRHQYAKEEMGMSGVFVCVHLHLLVLLDIQMQGMDDCFYTL